MKTIWVVQYNNGTADVYDSEQGAPALPYIDAFEVQNRIAELEAEVVDAFEDGYHLGVLRHIEGALEKDGQVIKLEGRVDMQKLQIEVLEGKLEALNEWEEDREAWIKRFERAVENKGEK